MNNWQPTMSWQDAILRAQFIHKIRSFFMSKGIIEVETPVLSAGTVTDVHLDAFETRSNALPTDPSGIKCQYHLQTSPEFLMKRLLAAGYESIFQISKAFRDEEQSKHHNPEFTMIEWYRLGFTQFDLMKEMEQLFEAVLDISSCDRISYQEVFLECLGLDPLATSKAKLVEVIKAADKYEEWLNNEDFDVLLQFIFSELIEVNIGQTAPCFVYDFPINQASLAKASKRDPRVAERFECYFKGLELANGFSELTSEQIQRERFNQDNIARKQRSKPTKDLDERFLSALETGLPECAGVALGLDRLLMVSLSKNSIQEVITFPFDRA